MLALLALSAGLVHLLPERIEAGPPRFLYDATSDRRLQDLLQGALGREGVLESRQILEEAARGDREAVGIVVEPFPGGEEPAADPGAAGRSASRRSADLSTAAGGGVSITLVYSGAIAPRQLKTIEAGLHRLWNQASRGAGSAGTAGGSARGQLTVLTLEGAAEPIAVNELVVPVLMLLEVIVLGFLFVAVTVFQEKQDGSIRDYRVSPGGAWTYILSKSVVWLLPSTAYGVLLLAATMGLALRCGPRCCR